MRTIQFMEPWWLLLLLILPLLYWWQFYRRQEKEPFIYLPSGLPPAGDPLKIRLLRFLPILRIFAIAMTVMALAKPVLPFAASPSSSQGIDIVLSLDISGSMLARDFEPDRLEAAKAVAKDFILSRPDDRIGLVIFGGESFTQCPVTTDHRVLLGMFDGINSNLLEDGTAIGMGLATAASRLKSSVAKSKVIILMTDGINNSGLIDPESAIEMAKQLGIRVYTIGVGTSGMAPYPVSDSYGNIQYEQMQVQIDETLLRKVANETGGNYYRATDNSSLKNIYVEIDKLEKSRITQLGYNFRPAWQEPFVLLALLLVSLEIFLRMTYLKTAL